ncbi:MAG: non-canonical purine NTP pyrophosphatase [Puniceicoccaceae bacterium]
MKATEGIETEGLVLASGNEHKAGEIEAWLRARDLRIRVRTAAAFGGMAGCGETAEDFEGNARIKVEFLRPKVPPGSWILADDSGLEVDALGGGPGVRSARFAGEGAGDRRNRELLLERMRDFPSARRRTARFVCVLALAEGPGPVEFFRGECEGRILPHPAGAGGFGYDPVFAPRGSGRSFAEIPAAEKNRISHRAKALEKLGDRLRI